MVPELLLAALGRPEPRPARHGREHLGGAGQLSAAGLRLSWLDVFADSPFGGNPLGVVHDADGVDPEVMGRLAFELGISETVYLLDGGRRVRIFTPSGEVPFAGHPIVGAALELARTGLAPNEGEITLETGVGPIHVELTGGRATMTQPAPEIGAALDPAEVAPLLGLRPEELFGEPRVCSTGVRAIFARVRGREALRPIRPDLRAIGAREDVLGVVAWSDSGADEVTQRFFAPRAGITEDPATGSAAGALGALRVFEGAEPGPLLVRQGAELGRGAEIHVEVGGATGAPGRPRVGGSAVLVFEARLAG